MHLRPSAVPLLRVLCLLAAGSLPIVWNHTGIIVEGGPVTTAVAVEARSRVLRHSFWDAYGPPCTDAVAVYRAKNLTDEQIGTIVAKAEEYVGDRYGYVKIAAHVLDWCLLGAYLFRRVAAMDKYPICSWVVACAYAKAGKNFGVAPGAATPDDIWISSPPTPRSMSASGRCK